jgi:hypothetical protein
VVSLFAFWLRYGAAHGGDLASARSFAFAVLVTAHVAWALSARRASAGLRLGVLGSPRLLAVVAATLVLQVAVGSVPLSAAALGLVPLGAGDWLLALGLGVLPVVELETGKAVARGRP